MTEQSAERYLTSQERDALERFRDSAGNAQLRELLVALFTRLKAHLLETHSSVDLDLAFALLEDEDSQILAGALWDADELSPFGEAFLAWAECQDCDPTDFLPAKEFEQFWAHSKSLWESLAVVEEPPEKAEEPASEAQQAPSEIQELPPPEEFFGPAEPVGEEESENLDEPEAEAEAEPVAEALPEDEPEDRPAEELSEPVEAEPDLVSARACVVLPAEDSELAEQETLALGDLARQAVAKAEMEAVLQERIQAILKTTLEEAPPVYQRAVTIEEIELPPDSARQQLSPDRRTVLHASRQSRSGLAEEVDEGEELEFSQAPVSPFEKKNQLVVKNKYLGYGKNSEGIVGLCGQLKISYFHAQPLAGRLECSNPLLFLSPSHLSGTSTTVTYWLPPVAFPHPAGQLVIRTHQDSKTLALHTLFPKSRTDFMGARQVLLAMFAPSLLGFLYFCFVYALTVHGIDVETRTLFPDLYSAALDGLQTVDFQTGGLGLFRLKVVPASESLQMIWATILFLAPLITSKFFHYLSRSRKRRLGGVLAAAFLMPSMLLLLGSNFQGHVLPLYAHKDFAPLDLWRFLDWSVPLNVVMAVYLFLSNFGYWDRWIKTREIRLAMPFVLTGLYLLTMFVLIYGRSWLS